MPAPRREHGSHHDRQPTRVQDLLPPGPQREVTAHRGAEVSVEVGPPVLRSGVAELPVELDQRPVTAVADVAVDGPDLLTLQQSDGLPHLALPGRQAVGPFDVAQVAHLQR